MGLGCVIGDLSGVVFAGVTVSESGRYVFSRGSAISNEVPPVAAAPSEPDKGFAIVYINGPILSFVGDDDGSKRALVDCRGRTPGVDGAHDRSHL